MPYGFSCPAQYTTSCYYRWKTTVLVLVIHRKKPTIMVWQSSKSARNNWVARLKSDCRKKVVPECISALYPRAWQREQTTPVQLLKLRNKYSGTQCVPGSKSIGPDNHH